MEDGFKSVPKIDLTFSSLIIPIQIELKPKPDAASNENPAAKVASWIENFSKISGGKFIFTLMGPYKTPRQLVRLHKVGCLLPQQVLLWFFGF